jgi:reductive dehalogenase
MTIICLITGALLFLFFILFAITSARENKPRATVISLLCAVITGALWYVYFMLVSSNSLLLIIPVAAIILFLALYLMPFGKPQTIKSNPTNDRVDERDIMFAREEYEPGTAKYEAYYKMRPENKKIDDKIRKLPAILEPGGRYYESELAWYIIRLFDFNESMTAMVDADINQKKEAIDPQAMTRRIKKKTLELGADEVGIADLNPAWVYSHVGRGPEKWGSPIENNHKFAIAFTLEMDYDHVEKGPYLPITEETAKQYMHGAIISIKLADYIRSLGYPARAHIAGSNYQIMLPPVAHDAGLGELGRHGYLISPEYGSRIRLGAVTTDLPLIPDKPIAFGVQDFCEKCKKCAVNCPSHAIPYGDKTKVRGIEKWQLNMEACLMAWRVMGSDCGLCMKTCPFSHPKALVHDIVRLGIKNSPFARTISAWGDDLFYGKKARY